MLRRHLQRMKRDERGSALVIALVMVFIVTIVVAAVLSYAGTGLPRTAPSATTASRSTRPTAPSKPPSRTSPTTRPCATTQATRRSPRSTSRRSPTPTSPRSTSTACATTRPTSPGTATRTPTNRSTRCRRWAAAPTCRRTKAATTGAVFAASTPPWGQVVEAGVYFQPSITGLELRRLSWRVTCYKQTGDVVIAGDVFSNSTVAVNNPTNSTPNQTIKTTARTVRRLPQFGRFGFTCARAARSRRAPPSPPTAVPAPSRRRARSSATAARPRTTARTPHYPSRGQWQAAQPAGFPAVQTVPACPTGTLVTFEPGWYNDANALNAVVPHVRERRRHRQGLLVQARRLLLRLPQPHRHCGRQPVLRHRHRQQPRATPRSQPQMNSSSAFAHEWCIRGKKASDGGADDNRPTIVGGTPKDWGVDPVTSLMVAASATQLDVRAREQRHDDRRQRRHDDLERASRRWCRTATSTATSFGPHDGNGRVIDTRSRVDDVAARHTTQSPERAATSTSRVPARRAARSTTLAVGTRSNNERQLTAAHDRDEQPGLRYGRLRHRGQRPRSPTATVPTGQPHGGS